MQPTNQMHDLHSLNPQKSNRGLFIAIMAMVMLSTLKASATVLYVASPKAMQTGWFWFDFGYDILAVAAMDAAVIAFAIRRMQVQAALFALGSGTLAVAYFCIPETMVNGVATMKPDWTTYGAAMLAFAVLFQYAMYSFAELFAQEDEPSRRAIDVIQDRLDAQDRAIRQATDTVAALKDSHETAVGHAEDRLRTAMDEQIALFAEAVEDAAKRKQWALNKQEYRAAKRESPGQATLE
jgi:hypothetical protein